MTVGTAIEPIPQSRWLAEAVARFGEDPAEWAFECPLCGVRMPLGMWKALGHDPNKGYVECIGNVLPADRRGTLYAVRQPCNWKAYGLFGTLRGGVEVAYDDAPDKTTWVFSFAPDRARPTAVLSYIDLIWELVP